MTAPRKPSAAPVAGADYQWLTTAPNPRTRQTGYDAGQTGWKLHAVLATKETKASDLNDKPALCGLVPAHGWGLDMFVDRECRRCLRKLGFLCMTCGGSKMRQTSPTHYTTCADCGGSGKSPAGREAARHGAR